MSRSLTGGSVAFAALLMSFAVSADTVTITGPYHFLDNRSFNSIGLVPGLRKNLVPVPWYRLPGPRVWRRRALLLSHSRTFPSTPILISFRPRAQRPVCQTARGR